jgi:hypothetical protein
MKMSTPSGYNGKVLQVAGSDETRAVEENDVVFNEQIIGSDPDADIRLQMLKSAGSAGGTGGEGDAGGGGA